MVSANTLLYTSIRILTSLKQFGIFVISINRINYNQLAMNFKIDTKEIFYVISLNEKMLTANMAEELISFVAEKQKEANKSLVISLQNVTEIEDGAFESIKQLHENMYEGKKSLVFCGLSPAIKKSFEQKELTEKINITPTESEAWDIVQMEEIERELDMDFV